MGILGLSRLIADVAPEAIKEVEMKSLFGRKIAIDASMSIYQFLIAIRNRDQVMTNDAGEATSHLIGLFYRTIKLIEAGIKPIYVFDGKAPQLKSGELTKRAERRKEAEAKLAEAKETQVQEDISRFNKRLVRVTRQHNEDCKKLLRLLGLPVIESPSEAEAQCAQLCKEGLVYATATEDMDGLTFGSPRLIRNLTSGNNDKVKEYLLEKVLTGLELDQKKFIDLGILMGCDYCESIKGIGGKKGLELIKKYGSIEEILEQKFNVTCFVDVEIDYGDRKEEVQEVIEETANGKHDSEQADPASEEEDVHNKTTESDDLQVNEEENEDLKEEKGDGDDQDKGKESKKKKSKDKSKEKVPENWLFLGARKLFQEPNVTKGITEVDLKQKDLDEEGIIEFLCKDNGFNEERVRAALRRVKDAKGKSSQTRIDSFFKMMPTTPNQKKPESGVKRGSAAKGSASKRGRKPK